MFLKIPTMKVILITKDDWDETKAKREEPPVTTFLQKQDIWKTLK